MFSSRKNRGECFPQNALYIALQGAAHNALEQNSKDTLPLCQLLLQQQYTLAEQRGFHLPAAQSHFCQSLESWAQTARVRLDQGFSAAAAQLEHLLQPEWGDGKGKGQFHCPHLRARKTDLETIKQFRMVEKNIWCFTYSTCHAHCIQRYYHPNVPFFPPPKNTGKTLPCHLNAMGVGTQQKDGSCNLVSPTA